MKCSYAKCPFGGQVEKESAVKDGSRYYHPVCKNEVDNRKAIVDIFKDINPGVVYQQLNAVLNSILYTKGISSDFVLFCMKYAKAREIEMYQPASLHSLINNSNIHNMYKRAKERAEERKRQGGNN
jgi:hypothetical protein